MNNKCFWKLLCPDCKKLMAKTSAKHETLYQLRLSEENFVFPQGHSFTDLFECKDCKNGNKHDFMRSEVWVPDES